MNISMKLVYQYMAIFFTFSPTSNHLHPLQAANCCSSSRLVVDENDNVKSALKGLRTNTNGKTATDAISTLPLTAEILSYKTWKPKGFFNLKSS